MTTQGGRPALPWQRPELIPDVSVHGRELVALTRIGRLAATSGPIAARAAVAVETIAEVMAFDAVALSAWDPLAGRHRNLAMLGVPEKARAGAGEDPFLDDPGYRYVRCCARRTADAMSPALARASSSPSDWSLPDSPRA